MVKQHFLLKLDRVGWYSYHTQTNKDTKMKMKKLTALSFVNLVLSLFMLAFSLAMLVGVFGVIAAIAIDAIGA